MPSSFSFLSWHPHLNKTTGSSFSDGCLFSRAIEPPPIIIFVVTGHADIQNAFRLAIVRSDLLSHLSDIQGRQKQLIRHVVTNGERFTRCVSQWLGGCAWVPSRYYNNHCWNNAHINVSVPPTNKANGMRHCFRIFLPVYSSFSGAGSRSWLWTKLMPL